MKKLLDRFVLILFFSILSLLIMLLLTYSKSDMVKDLLITFISIFSFLILIYDKLLNK